MKGRKRIRCSLIMNLLLITCFFISAQSFSSNGSLRVGNTSFKITQGTGMVLTQGLSVASGARFLNNGSLWLNNGKEEALNINTLLGGTGMYYISGAADYVLTGDAAAVSSLTVNGGHTLWVENEFAVTSNLVLENGFIDIADGFKLQMQSADIDAIAFNNDVDNNSSFIIGTLERNINPGNEYIFPLGTRAEGFHPFTVGDISSTDYASVTYEPNFYNLWNSSLGADVGIETVGGWTVRTQSITSFIPGLSLYNINNVLEGYYNIFYSANPDDVSPDFLLDFNSVSQGATLTTSERYSAGMFALAKITTTLEGDEEVPVPELVNFIVKDGGGRTTFEVPGIFNYSEVTLSIYSRFGNLIYRSNSYANDFDTQNYRAGTYFYELGLKTADGKGTMIRNIIEIMERN